MCLLSKIYIYLKLCIYYMNPFSSIYYYRLNWSFSSTQNHTDGKKCPFEFHKNFNFVTILSRLNADNVCDGFLLMFGVPTSPMLFRELPEAEYLEGIRTEVAVGILAASANQQHYSRYSMIDILGYRTWYMCICRKDSNLCPESKILISAISLLLNSKNEQ